jgi:hypothetical protein
MDETSGQKLLIVTCVTYEYDDKNQGDQMILYGCKDLSNKLFKLGKVDSSGFSNIVV